MMKRERKNLFFQSLFLFHLLTATINENPTVYFKTKQTDTVIDFFTVCDFCSVLYKSK